VDRTYLDGLNFDQRLAVEHGIGPDRERVGPLLVIAGAGSGKTNTLAHRVAHLIVNGADPSRILLLTFSRRAAKEMTTRAETIAARVLKTGSVSIAWAGTFHSIGARLLRQEAQAIGLDAGFTIADREDAADLMNYTRNRLEFGSPERRFPKKDTCLSIYSRAVNSSSALEDLIAEHFPWCRDWTEQLRALFGAYVEAKQQQSILDYDDLLLYWCHMLDVAEIAESVSAQFDHVLVDEYQDTNALQASILLKLRPEGADLTVVGDDAQSIYGFRSATIRNILDFPDSFAQRATIVTLERNYRSTQPILTASNYVIGLSRERYSKDLWTDRQSEQRPWLVVVSDAAAQAAYVAEHVLANAESGVSLKSQAVLFRTSHHSAQLEIELGRRNIPFVKFGGLKFLDTAHVKDVLAILKWSTNLRDVASGFRVLNLFRGIGPKTAGKLMDALQTSTDNFSALSDFRPPPLASIQWHGFLELQQSLRGTLAGWPAELDTVCAWYIPLLEEIYEDATSRTADLRQLQQIAAGVSSREHFLTDLALDPPDAASDLSGIPYRNDDYLTLSTIHSAKGLEWNSVFMLNVVDGCIPSDLGTGSLEEIEEERRLLYVGMTRAKEQLHLMVPYKFFVTGQAMSADRYVTAMRTRFIPPSILGAFELISWPKASIEKKHFERPVLADIGSRIRNTWW
jgi:DNA helicase-2/ATP-dependent DNA helicase PcrA